jgi:LytS/YehU family sensor histidine kinase
VLGVEDDGGSTHGSAGGGLGIGLSNARQRLMALYGDDARLDSAPLEHGWRSVIRVPWQEDQVPELDQKKTAA